MANGREAWRMVLFVIPIFFVIPVMSEIYFDLETQNMSYEVGGWQNLEAVRVSVACTWDEDNKSRTWWESQAVDLLATLQGYDLIIGFNVTKFDYRVLAFYSDIANQLVEKTFDLLLEIQIQGYGLVGLDTVARLNLGAHKLYKSADAVDLWREGKLKELEEYCQMDVELTRQVTEHWAEHGVLWLDGNFSKYALWPGLRPTALVAAGLYGDRD